MALKPNGKTCQIKEQIIEDLVTGLTLKFSAYDEEANLGYKLTLVGEVLPYGNRDFIFQKDGNFDGTGTSKIGVCRPSWLEEIKN